MHSSYIGVVLLVMIKSDVTEKLTNAYASGEATFRQEALQQMSAHHACKH